MLLHKTPNHTIFCGDRLKNAGDIRDREFVLPEKVSQSSPKNLRDATVMPNFIKIGQTSLEIGVGREKNSTHTHTRHPDWLSRASQHARGATKNNHHATVEQFETVKVQRNFRQFCGDLRLECGRRRFLGPPPTLPCIWHELQPTQRSVDSTHNIVVHASSKTTTTTTWHTRACRVSIWNFRRVPEDALDYAATRRRDRTVTGREYSTPKSFSTCAKDPVFLTLLLILSFDIFL